MMERLCALRSEPSFIVDTGGGLAAFWRLEDPAANLASIEDINAGIADAFAADRCHNIDRLMRLPGTINWPNKKKMAAGRRPSPASVLIEDQGVLHEPVALAAEFPRIRRDAERATVNVDGPSILLTADDFNLGPLDPLRSLIDSPAGDDRSKDALRCAGRMVRDGYSDEQIFGVLMNPANAVHAHIGAQSDPRYQALRCIEAARTPNPNFSQPPRERGRTRFDDYGADAGILAQGANDDQPEIDQGFFCPSKWEGLDVPPRLWMLPDWVPLLSTTYLTGLGATGKSLLTQQLATCIAVGINFLGMEVRRCISAYITCEDDQDGLHRRQRAINDMLGITWAHLEGRMLLRSFKGEQHIELATFDDANTMTVTARYRSIHATLQHFGVQFAVMDNVAHLFAGNENIRGQVAQFCGLMDRLAMDIGGSTLLLGHPNKAGQEFSGSTAWENQVRSRIYLKRPDVEDGGFVDPDARVLSRSKPNYAQMGEEVEFIWRNWAFTRSQDIPKNMMPDGADLAETMRAGADNDLFLSCLRVRNKQQRPVSERPSATYAPSVFATMSESKGIGKKRLTAAMDRLFRLAKIERGFLFRDGAEGKDKHGLREASANGSAASANASANAPLTDPPTHPLTAANLTANSADTHSYIIDIGGAAHEAAAPPKPEQGGTGTKFPRPTGGSDGKSPRVVFPPEGGYRSIAEDLTGPLPEHLRDPFNPSDWPAIN